MSLTATVGIIEGIIEGIIDAYFSLLSLQSSVLTLSSGGLELEASVCNGS